MADGGRAADGGANCSWVAAGIADEGGGRAAVSGAAGRGRAAGGNPAGAGTACGGPPSARSGEPGVVRSLGAIDAADPEMGGSDTRGLATGAAALRGGGGAIATEEARGAGGGIAREAGEVMTREGSRITPLASPGDASWARSVRVTPGIGAVMVCTRTTWVGSGAGALAASGAGGDIGLEPSDCRSDWAPVRAGPAAARGGASGLGAAATVFASGRLPGADAGAPGATGSRRGEITVGAYSGPSCFGENGPAVAGVVRCASRAGRVLRRSRFRSRCNSEGVSAGTES